MKIMSIPQPYAGYIVAGWLPNIVVPREYFDEDELIVCADGRRSLPPRGWPGGMYTPPADPALIEPVGVALGIVSMAGTQEAEETELGIPYMAGRYYLAVQRPRIFNVFPDRVCSQQARLGPMPMIHGDHFIRGLGQLKYQDWRQIEANTPPQLSSGPTTPSKDGWTGD